MWHHLSRHQFFLFNGQILAVNLRSYNGQDVKHLIKSNVLDQDWTAMIQQCSLFSWIDGMTFGTPKKI